MTGRRHRVSASTGKIAIGPVRTGKRPLKATTLSAMSPHQRSISDSSHLKNDVELQLQDVKNYMDHEHAAIFEQIEAQSSKLKKRWKQERQNLSTTAEAADNDWRNFLADNEEDTQENQVRASLSHTKSPSVNEGEPTQRLNAGLLQDLPIH